MATDSLLAALQGNYGLSEIVIDDVGTVRGLLDFCKKWLKGKAHADELLQPCSSMASRLRLGADEMKRDLDRNQDMALEMRQPIERTVEAYLTIAELLDELPAMAEDENLVDFKDNLEAFEEERLAVLDAQEEIQFQLSGKTLLCPKCGLAGEESSCPRCGLVRLYPDPESYKARFQQATLSGIYGKVFRMYQRVAGGERPLVRMAAALDPLEEHLEALQDTRKRLLHRIATGELSKSRRGRLRAVERLLGVAAVDIGRALAGVERMRSAEVSLKLSDLSRGWEDIFHAAKAIEVVVVQIRRELGVESDALVQGEDSTSGLLPAQDQISFSRE